VTSIVILQQMPMNLNFNSRDYIASLWCSFWRS